MSWSSEKSFRPHEVHLDRVQNDVHFEGPKRLGYFWFSCNDEDESGCKQDKSSLRYLDLPDPINIDCLQGYDPKIKYGHNQSKSTNLLRWILENETILSNFPYDFICSSGILKDIMISSYNAHDWNLSAIKIRGKIILNRMVTFEMNDNIESRSELGNKSTYAAVNLQRLITKSKNCFELDSEKEENSFFGVFHSKIGFHRILYAGYLDCVESKQDLDKSFADMKFVSIKKFNAPKDSHTSHHANTWWSLATLTGVDTIICAKCEQDFTVKNIDKLHVDSLINKQRQMILSNSLDTILGYVKSIVQDEDNCYSLRFSGKRQKLLGYWKMALHENMIPSWYIDGQLPDKSQ